MAWAASIHSSDKKGWVTFDLLRRCCEAITLPPTRARDDATTSAGRYGAGVRARRANRPAGRVTDVVAALVVVALAVIAACSPARPSVAGDPAGAASGVPKVRGTVALTGDSLTVGELASLPGAAEQAGVRLLIAAQVGRTLAEGTAALKAIYHHPDLVVVALGTNDATAALTATQADDAIDATMAVVDSDVPVLWLSLYRDQQTPEGAAADRFNLSLRRATARHANLSIVDWRAYVVTHLDVLAPDGVHLTEAGYAARTAWLVAAIGARLPAA
jgi:lysophospholipase L1-like esterase